MIKRTCLFVACFGWIAAAGCAERVPQYGVERQVVLDARQRGVWAVAPAINLSGYDSVDPLLQADLLYQQLQQVKGLTVLPVNRVAEVYASLGIDKVQSEEQAAQVCQMLGCDALLVPTVTIYDPYSPPKFGASLQLLGRASNGARPASVDPRQLSRAAGSEDAASQPDRAATGAVQAVGMFDAANGSVRESLLAYAAGRNDPVGPMGPKEYIASMDRFCGFAYHELIVAVLSTSSQQRS
jgi:hypothetical protein